LEIPDCQGRVPRRPLVITDTQDALLKKIECAIDAKVVDQWTYADHHDFAFAGEIAKGVRFRLIFCNRRQISGP
jgi:hypothetical protein